MTHNKPKILSDIPIYANVYPKDLNNREINIYKMERCIVSSKSSYYPGIILQTNLESIYPIEESSMSLGPIEYQYGSAPAPMSTENEPVFYFVYNTENYYHYVYDTLPYLISFFWLKRKIPSLKLIMQYPSQQRTSHFPFVIEFLDLLGIEDILLLDTEKIYSAIYISSSYTHGNTPPRAEIFDFFRNMVKFLPEKSPGNPTKFYVSRRTYGDKPNPNIGTDYTTRRKLANEDELVAGLTNIGYTEVFTEKLSVKNKLSMFSKATEVVGCIGGGLVNLVFSPRNTILTVIVSPTFLDVNGRFRYCLDQVNTTYYDKTAHVECGPYKTNMRVKYNGGIGEIRAYDGNTLTIEWTKNNISGFNRNTLYEIINVSVNRVIPMDKGLNSPWKIIDLSVLLTRIVST
jgi:capsular polysaccharide biosynthesis protein